MVFETLVSDLLNRFIGDYVENLDKSQLKIGIWGAIKYDAAKEERYIQEAKQKELQRIEEALQTAARRASQTGDFLFNLESVVYKEPPNVKPQDTKKDTFAEKLATQVIKNIQVKITSIHIRYEDDLSDPECPLSMGVTLAELSLQTTDENWKTCIMNEAAKIIYKDKLKAGISTKNEELKDYQYFFKPIFASAKMCINSNGEIELNAPKANLYLEVQNIAIEMTKPQYLTMLDLLQSLDYMVKNGPYRKFRPEVPVHRNTGVWWGYAFKSILEVHIRRCKMWSWPNIRKHRDNLKAYKAAWKARLLTKGKLSVDTDKQIQDLENILDVFNITLARQQAQMEVIRSGQKVVAKKTAGGQKPAGGGGGFFGFFNRKVKKEEQEESKEPESSGLDELMTTEEKEKLYTAIGYSGSSHNLAVPKEYVAVVINFKLSRTSITVRELPNVPEILKVQMIDLSTKICQRPGAQAVKVEASLKHWFVTGLKQQGRVPSLIASVGESESSLLSVRFELNPEDSAADQLLHVHSQPVEIIYDALTVNSMVEFFKTGKETRKILDLRIDVKPSYLLLPKSGFYHANSSLEEIMDRAYERYSLELRCVQILFSKSGEAWKTARLKGSSVQHILQPMDFTVQLAKCMVEKDARMARFKVSGELPLIHVKISDQKIQGVYELVDSIPLPNMGSPPSTPTENVLSLATQSQSSRARDLGLHPALLDTMETDSSEDASERSMDEDQQRSAVEELTDVQFKFEVKKADSNGPFFQSVFENTEQTLKVEFSSLDFLLHTKALLSTINYLSSALPPELTASRDKDTRKQVEKAGPGKTVSKGSKDASVINFKLFAMLGCFHVEVCDDLHNIADLRVQGINASVLVQAKQTEVIVRLRDIVVMDVDPKTIHKKAVSIMSEEVFSFKLSLYPSATEGEGYSDTSKVDGKVTLKLGCIRIVYLHKFLMSLMTFVDNFQTAKEALSAAAVQAAEKAASSVREFAQKSFRLYMDVQLKAPLIIVPQSSVSYNAFVVDLGLITVENSFSLVATEGNLPLPAVLEKMDVKLTRLKLSRTTLKQDSPQADIEILQPINLELVIHRNLAASWFTKVPGVQVDGVLKTMNMCLGQEDFGVLMKILVENIGEGKKAVLSEEQTEPVPPGSQPVGTNGALEENTTNVLLNFEIKEVVLKLTKSRGQKESAFLVLHMSQLGIDTRVRRSDLCATTYIKNISMKCLEFTDSAGEPLCLIRSSVESGAELLKVQYFKADRSSPNFATVYKNTEQMINVTLLSTMNFLSATLSSDSLPSPKRELRPKLDEPSKAASAKSSPPAAAADTGVIDLKVMMQLGAFNVLVCDQSCSMADIKIQDEVFSFSMGLTPSATEGRGYADTSQVDGRVKLNVGCIQVVYLHKFVMSLLNFTDHFQTAKEALSAATVQAAEKAASSVLDFAKKSFRLSMDVRLKAPLIIVPQSSVSHNALEVDLGLITVENSFSALPVEGYPLPAIIDNMDIRFTELKLSRICMDPASAGLCTKVLEPVNLVLSIKRNLAASWYKKMAAVEVDGDLKPMTVSLSQEDLRVLLKILTENLGEASGLQSVAQNRQEPSLQLRASGCPTTDGALQPRETEDQEEEPVETVKFKFNIESLGLVLYSNDPKQMSIQAQRQESLQLGQFALHQLRTSGKLLTDGSLEVSTVLSACTLDDLRSGMQRVTSQMVGRQAGDSSEAMIDITYRQSATQREVVAVLQKLYLCASVEFLMAVADFFVQALPQSPAQLPVASHTDKLPLKQMLEHGIPVRTQTAVGPRTRLRAVVVDPEVVFVANLMKADAPALVASFQCNFSLTLEPDGAQAIRANLRELKVLACPFIHSKEDKAVTTVLKPCSVVLETNTLPNQPLNGSLTVEEVIVKISPVILNTVMTITSAMTAKPQDQQDQEAKLDVRSLWSIMNIYECNFWFLGVDQATEVTESFKEQDGRNMGESFGVEVKVVQVTMESGLGHRTVPLLLVESSFTGMAKNWSSLLNLSADMTLEVNYFNETHAIWEPLIERVDNGTRRWNLKLEMKINPVQDKSPVPGDDFVILPEPRTAINICSKDTMNITVSQCALNVFHNLAK
ncbi:hypothetical protein NHX12_005220, partial [Muraenolepis orangiensis]